VPGSGRPHEGRPPEARAQARRNRPKAWSIFRGVLFSDKSSLSGCGGVDERMRLSNNVLNLGKNTRFVKVMRRFGGLRAFA
jgi:hypothetical protein